MAKCLLPSLRSQVKKVSPETGIEIPQGAVKTDR